MAALHLMNCEHDAVGWRFDNSYARLPDVFFTEARPAAVAGPSLVILNRQLMGQLGLDFDQISPEAVARVLSGQDQPSGSQPIAQAYAGHQFGNFTMLGDGRAILLGEHRTPAGQLVDKETEPFKRRFVKKRRTRYKSHDEL